MAKTTEVNFITVWRLEVQDAGVNIPGFFWGFSSRLADGCLLTVSSCGLFSACVSLLSLFYSDVLILQGYQLDWSRAPIWPHLILITSLKVKSLKVLSPNMVIFWGHWEYSQHMNLEGHDSAHNTFPFLASTENLCYFLFLFFFSSQKGKKNIVIGEEYHGQRDPLGHCLMKWKLLSHVRLFATPWAVAC